MKFFQIQHCKHRAGEILYNKERKLKEKHTIKAKILPLAKKLKLISHNAVKLKSIKTIKEETQNYDLKFDSDIEKYFDFSKYCWPETIHPKYKTDLNKLYKEHDQLIDNIILGGCEEAKQMLIDWEKS